MLRYFLLACLLGVLAGPARAQAPRWERTVDLLPGTELFGYMQTLTGGDYLVYGAGSGSPGYSAILARYQPDGTLVYQRRGRRLSTLEQDVVALGPAGLLLLGSVADPSVRFSPPPNLFLQRLRANGDTLPGLRYPGSLFQGIPARMLPDGPDSVRLLLSGWGSGPTPAYFALATADTAGHLGPIRRYPSPTPYSAYACDLVPTARGGWLLAGEVFTDGANLHPYLVETDRLGRLRRQRVLTLFSATDNERVARTWHNLIRLRDGSGYVLSGWHQLGTNSANPTWGFLCKLDTALNLVWTYRHPPQFTTRLLPTRVRELPDGSLGWLAGDVSGGGQRSPYLYLLRLSAQGQLLRQRTYASPTCSGLTLYSWQPTPDGYGAVVTGGYATCTGTGSSLVAYTARLDSALVLATAAPAGGRPADAAQLWPTPARASEGVTWQGPVPAGPAPAELLLLDALGRVVRRLPLAGRGAQVTQAVPLAGLAPGAYAVRLLVAGVPAGPPARLLVSAP